MNKHRRKVLHQLFSQLIEIRDNLEIVVEEENEAKDNFPENLQQSERYEAMEEAVYNLEEAFSGIETAIDSLGSIE